eukprot:869861-Amphidinium_carterae.1
MYTLCVKSRKKLCTTNPPNHYPIVSICPHPKLISKLLQTVNCFSLTLRGMLGNTLAPCLATTTVAVRNTHLPVGEGVFDPIV